MSKGLLVASFRILPRSRDADGLSRNEMNGCFQYRASRVSTPIGCATVPALQLAGTLFENAEMY